MKPGEVGAPVSIGSGWVAYTLVEKQEANQADFDKQKKEITDSLLQTKKGLAFEAFRTALDARLKKAGTLKTMPEKLKTFGSFS